MATRFADTLFTWSRARVGSYRLQQRASLLWWKARSVFTTVAITLSLAMEQQAIWSREKEATSWLTALDSIRVCSETLRQVIFRVPCQCFLLYCWNAFTDTVWPVQTDKAEWQGGIWEVGKDRKGCPWSALKNTTIFVIRSISTML